MLASAELTTATYGLVIGSETCGEEQLRLILVNIILNSHCFVVGLLTRISFVVFPPQYFVLRATFV